MVAVELPQEITTSFVAEARSYLPLIVQSLAAPRDTEKVGEAYRFAHTIKSSAAMMGHTGLSQVAELLEGDLEGLLLGEELLPDQVAVLSRSVDRIGRLLDGVAGEAIDVDAIIAEEVNDRVGQEGEPLPAAADAAAGRDEPAQVAANTEAAAPPQPALNGKAAAGVTPVTAETAAPVEAAGAPAQQETVDSSATVHSSATVESGAPAATAKSGPPGENEQPLPAEQTLAQRDPTQDAAVADATAEPTAAAVQPPAAEPARVDGATDKAGATRAPKAAAEADATQAADAQAGSGQAQPPSSQKASRGTPARGAATERAARIESSPLTPLIERLADNLFALSREVEHGNEDLAGPRQLLAEGLAAFDQMAGLVPSPSDTPAPEAPEASAAPAARRGRTQRAADEDLAVELDPAAGAEDSLRRTLEAELRFQIEEEVRARLAAQAPAAPAGPIGAVHRGSAAAPARAAGRPAPVPAAVAPAGGTGDSDVDREMREIFALEAEEHLQRIDADLAVLDGNAQDLERLRSLRRTVHTLKGAAAMMGFDAVAELAHSLEDRLDAVTAGEAKLEAAGYSLILQDLGRLEQLIRATIAGEPLEAAAPAPAAAGTDTLEAAPAPAFPSTELPHQTSMTVAVRLEQLDGLLTLAGESTVSVGAWPNLLGEATSALVDLRRSLDRMQSLVATMDAQRFEQSAVHLRQIRTVDGERAAPTEAWPQPATDFDALELDRYTPLDYAMRELSEIATEAAAAEREITSTVESAAELVTAQRRHAVEMQERLLNARLVPLTHLADRLQRAARGVALKREKDVDFGFDGATVNVDRAILDAMEDALIHLVRNAADHGLESEADRVAAGKTPVGTLRVLAQQEQDEILIDVSDDGRGLDIEGILAAARRAGLPEEHLTPERAAELIFWPGLTTSEKVDDVSGRGVGLDAVSEAVSRVRGQIQVATEPGRGTTFSLRFPVTLAQARVVMLEAAGNPYAVPAAAVRRIARLSELQAEQPVVRNSIHHDGEEYPIVDLALALGVDAAQDLPEDPPVVLVDAAGGRAAWLTQKVGSQDEVVVKRTGTHLRTPKGVAGATLLEDGRVALLLHLADLFAGGVAAHISSAPAAGARGAIRPPGTGREAALRVLVVDDSPTIRKLLVRMLKDLGWFPVEAKDGIEALETIRISPPDIVLADIEMPRLDGYGLLADLRSREETAGLPVLMLTSRTAERHRRRAAELGASGYITKPYRAADVVAELRRLGLRVPNAAVA